MGTFTLVIFFKAYSSFIYTEFYITMRISGVVCFSKSKSFLMVLCKVCSVSAEKCKYIIS